MNHLPKSKKIYLSLIYVFPLFISTYLHPQDEKFTIKEPYQIVSKNDLKDIEYKEGDSPEKLEEKISKIVIFIDSYYSQFPEDRRTDSERKRAGEYLDPKTGDVSRKFRENAGRYPLQLNVNSVRLIKGQSSLLPSNSSLIEDSYTLYKLYSNLGFLYSRKNESDKAISSFLTALKFHDFSQNEDTLFKEINSKDNLESERVEKIKQHKETLNSKTQHEKLIETKIDTFHLNAANSARESKLLPDEKAFRKEIEALNLELNSKVDVYNKSLEGLFVSLQKDKGIYDSKVIKEFAFQVKAKELQERTLQRITKPYPLIDPDKESGFIGYFQLLEFAHRLNPDDIDILKYLGDEFKATGKTQKAIDFYTKYLNVNNPEKKLEDDVCLSLAGLYSSGKNYIQAKEYYDRYLNLSGKENDKKDYYFVLGDLLIKRLGNFEEAVIYLDKYISLTSTMKFPEEDYINNLKMLKNRMSSYYYIAKFYKSKINRESEDLNMQKSYDEYYKIKNLESSFENKMALKKEELIALKKKALSSTDSLVLESLNEENKKFEALKSIKKSIKTEMDTLLSMDLLFQMAERNENKRDYEKAVLIYREIQDIGTPPDRELALRNIRRIELIKYDGINREKISR
jgi:tetratricopeptide (TPR) repeat protein